MDFGDGTDGVCEGAWSMRLSRLAFVGALLLLAYVVGDATDGTEKLWTEAEGVWQRYWAPPRLDGQFADVEAGDAATRRVRLFAPALAGPVVVAGGRYRFMDHCPGFVGCAAVEYDRSGRFVHGYPFRPGAYEAAMVPHGLPQPVGFERGVGFDFAKRADVSTVATYSNGDLAVTVEAEGGVFPSALGIARIDREGWPRWFRADGSHDSVTIVRGQLRGVGAGRADLVVVPGRRMGVGAGRRENIWEQALGRFPCERHFVDSLYVIDGDGALLRQVAVAEALQGSRHGPMLGYSRNACDPLHLNSVAVLAVDGPSGLAAGDFLVSMRDLGALAVLDGADGRLKQVWRGGFYGQHGARELAGPTGPTFLLFDSGGLDAGRRPGRLLALDPRTGRERTLFPNASSPVAAQELSRTRGGISVAPGGSRAIVHGWEGGQAVEVDLVTGEATAIFQVLDDVSALADVAGAADQAFRWPMRDIGYVAAAGRRAAD